MNSLLSALRISKHWDFKDVADELEIDSEEYEKIENGEKGMTVETAVKLGNLYSIPPETFFDTVSKTINNNIGTYSKGIVNAVHFHEAEESKKKK